MATHNDTEGHDTPTRALAPCKPAPLATRATVHPPGPPSGSAEVSTFPAPSTATHNDTEGHDTASKPFESTRTGENHTRREEEYAGTATQNVATISAASPRNHNTRDRNPPPMSTETAAESKSCAPNRCSRVSQ